MGHYATTLCFFACSSYETIMLDWVRWSHSAPQRRQYYGTVVKKKRDPILPPLGSNIGNPNKFDTLKTNKHLSMLQEERLIPRRSRSMHNNSILCTKYKTNTLTHLNKLWEVFLRKSKRSIARSRSRHINRIIGILLNTKCERDGAATNVPTNLSERHIINNSATPPLKSVRNSNMCETRLGCFYVTAILSWGYGWGWIEVDIEAEVDLKWGWDKIVPKFSWTWVEVELSLRWDNLTLNKGRNWAFIRVGLWFKICFMSTHVSEQHMFSMSPSILAFDFI